MMNNWLFGCERDVTYCKARAMIGNVGAAKDFQLTAYKDQEQEVHDKGCVVDAIMSNVDSPGNPYGLGLVFIQICCRPATGLIAYITHWSGTYLDDLVASVGFLAMFINWYRWI
jgi:hypothetical protein